MNQNTIRKQRKSMILGRVSNLVPFPSWSNFHAQTTHFSTKQKIKSLCSFVYFRIFQNQKPLQRRTLHREKKDKMKTNRLWITEPLKRPQPYFLIVHPLVQPCLKIKIVHCFHPCFVRAFSICRHPPIIEPLEFV